jgi:hypothetical protein
MSSEEPNEVLFCALGEAVARIWSALPQIVQHQVFEEAATSHGKDLRQQLAVFLHDKHSRTSDAIKAQAILEPDSPGG